MKKILFALTLLSFISSQSFSAENWRDKWQGWKIHTAEDPKSFFDLKDAKSFYSEYDFINAILDDLSANIGQEHKHWLKDSYTNLLSSGGQLILYPDFRIPGGKEFPAMQDLMRKNIIERYIWFIKRLNPNIIKSVKINLFSNPDGLYQKIDGDVYTMYTKTWDEFLEDQSIPGYINYLRLNEPKEQQKSEKKDKKAKQEHTKQKGKKAKSEKKPKYSSTHSAYKPEYKPTYQSSQESWYQQSSGEQAYQPATKPEFIILGLSSTANTTNTGIKKAYRKLARRVHPDMFADKPEEQQQEAEKCYKILRKAYDIAIREDLKSNVTQDEVTQFQNFIQSLSKQNH